MQTRKTEQEQERARNENAQDRHDSLMQMLIQQQQQQTANFQALISQQNQAMLILMAKLAKKMTWVKVKVSLIGWRHSFDEYMEGNLLTGVKMKQRYLQGSLTQC